MIITLTLSFVECENDENENVRIIRKRDNDDLVARSVLSPGS